MAEHRNGAVRQPRSLRRRAEPVTTATVRPDAWQQARRLAQGDSRLIRVCSATRVRVLDVRYR